MRSFVTKPLIIVGSVALVAVVASGVGRSGGSGTGNDGLISLPDLTTTTHGVGNTETAGGAPTETAEGATAEKAEGGATTGKSAGGTTRGAKEATTGTGGAATGPAGAEDSRELAFKSVFEDKRVRLTETLEKDLGDAVGSVFEFFYDEDADMVVLGVTSNYSTDEHLANAAWIVTSTVAELFEFDGDSRFRPGLNLAVIGRRWSCSGDFMRRLAANSASRADWDRECQARA